MASVEVDQANHWNIAKLNITKVVHCQLPFTGFQTKRFPHICSQKIQFKI